MTGRVKVQAQAWALEVTQGDEKTIVHSREERLFTVTPETPITSIIEVQPDETKQSPAMGDKPPPAKSSAAADGAATKTA